MDDVEKARLEALAANPSTVVGQATAMRWAAAELSEIRKVLQRLSTALEDLTPLPPEEDLTDPVGSPQKPQAGAVAEAGRGTDPDVNPDYGIGQRRGITGHPHVDPKAALKPWELPEPPPEERERRQAEHDVVHSGESDPDYIGAPTKIGKRWWEGK